MACNWSAENATNAFLKTLKMVKEQGHRAKEPESAEFISALAAGNNSQLIVVASATAAAPSMLSALVTAAHQTGGRVVCIHRTQHETELSKRALGSRSRQVGFVTGEAQELLASSAQYSGADFVLIDCHLDNHERILGAVQEEGEAGTCKRNGVVVVGYNAFGSGSWGSSGRWRTQLLPIGEGLLVTRMAPPARNKSRWVVKVDKCTGEEHVFRIRSPQGKIQA